MLTSKDCQRITDSFPWHPHSLRPTFVRLVWVGPQADGMFSFRITFAVPGHAMLNAEGTTAESALCTALSGWGLSTGDGAARNKAFAVWRRLTN